MGDGWHLTYRNYGRRYSLMTQRVAIPSRAKHEGTDIPSVRMDDLQNDVEDKQKDHQHPVLPMVQQQPPQFEVRGSIGLPRAWKRPTPHLRSTIRALLANRFCGRGTRKEVLKTRKNCDNHGCHGALKKLGFSCAWVDSSQSLIKIDMRFSFRRAAQNSPFTMLANFVKFCHFNNIS